jgi:hypothetical protein
MEFDKLHFGIGRHKSTGTKAEDHDWVGPQCYVVLELFGAV